MPEEGFPSQASAIQGSRRSFGTRKGHEHLFETAERLARQFRLAGQVNHFRRHRLIMDQHPLINLLDWYQQLKLVADNVAKAPTRGVNGGGEAGGQPRRLPR